MEHILAVTAPTVVAPPSVTRLPHNPTSGVGGPAPGPQALRYVLFRSVSLRPVFGLTRGYLYKIRCLRL